MSKKGYFEMGTLAVSLVVAVAMLTANSAKADVVLNDRNNNGNPYVLEFNTNDTGGYIVGNSYTVSETFSLADPNWFFTSFSLNPENVNLMVQSVINNVSPSMPAVDLTGEFTGTARWTGQVVIKSGSNVLFDTNVQNFSDNNIAGLRYDDGSLLEGVPGFSASGGFNIGFNELQALRAELTDEVFGVKEITFDFTLSDIFFENNEIRGLSNAGIGNTWDGSISGLVSMTYDTSVNATPEPASLLLFGLGTAGVGVVAYRKRKGKK